MGLRIIGQGISNNNIMKSKPYCAIVEVKHTVFYIYWLGDRVLEIECDYCCEYDTNRPCGLEFSNLVEKKLLSKNEKELEMMLIDGMDLIINKARNLPLKDIAYIYDEDDGSEYVLFYGILNEMELNKQFGINSNTDSPDIRKLFIDDLIEQKEIVMKNIYS